MCNYTHAAVAILAVAVCSGASSTAAEITITKTMALILVNHGPSISETSDQQSLLAETVHLIRASKHDPKIALALL